ncbi:hypothetical protein C8A00DRAFT_39076 [Chaetomidium leptoderma]|uniref:Uncharacterized protein n=1 Tax=Chaetomidium leptoderma TaxID=669021 RepID=A0AAN6ZRL8_9PEZI|nr:hypothetical protein C8A00DRAFT_39076 [Chaetomidium leptoderma]
MPLTTKLPYKAVGPMKLARRWFLTPLAPACRHFFNEGHGMGPSNIGRLITPNTLLPYAVALIDSSQLPRPLVGSSVIALLDDLYCRPARLAARAPQLPTSLVQRMGYTHSAILASATDFAALALERISLRDGAISTSLPLSPSELFRFCRAFYRVELFYRLFRGGAFADDVNRWFFWRQPPWENEQLGCICCYLEAKLDQVLANCNINHVEEDKQDFLNDNALKPYWLAQGVEFVSKLTNAPSYKDKQNMLNTGLNASFLDKANVELPEILYAVYFGDGTQDFEEACDSVAPHRYGQPNDEDTDLGPYEAWRTENVGWGVPESFIPEPKAWLRDRAYVLWDSDRVRKMGGFKNEDEV